MRRQDPSRLKAGIPALLAAIGSAVFIFAAGIAVSQDAPRLRGAPQPMEEVPAPPLARPVTDDVRRMRAYPEQPPVIPHAIEGYQLSLRANRCLECHSRQYTEASGAPMISVTHFMDREGQMLADVSPRRYFCLQCHVLQTDARPLVENDFVDMLHVGSNPDGN
jgi:cytochrome c-type protein NapB